MLHAEGRARLPAATPPKESRPQRGSSSSWAPDRGVLRGGGGVGPGPLCAECIGVALRARWRVHAACGLRRARRKEDAGRQAVYARGDNIAAMVLHTGRPARMDSHDNAAGSAAAQIRELDLRGGVGAPIIVDGRLWGAAIVGSSRPEPLPADTEAQVGDFTELVATAIANAESHAELTASRARIVSAADDARRRIERDLHDGAQ
jgi:transcriptional regulator with GAF, ATPase, and Fis domain